MVPTPWCNFAINSPCDAVEIPGHRCFALVNSCIDGSEMDASVAVPEESVTTDAGVSEAGRRVESTMEADESGLITEQSRWLSGRQLTDDGYETTFGVDLNGNGFVGV